ncbi:helix-turn-helix transcriptional regulator [Phocaeicola dorei]|nr:helix-turn-helix transcriptional regulator [Phocaeicola dorei]
MCLHRLAAELLPQILRSAVQDEASGKHGYRKVRFEKLLRDYFHSDSLSKNGLPTVKYFADRLNLSSDYLTAVLQRETGMNTRKHIQNRMIETAKDKLALDERPISQIAYELGFEYPQYFTRLFKRQTGMTHKRNIADESSLRYSVFKEYPIICYRTYRVED